MELWGTVLPQRSDVAIHKGNPAARHRTRARAQLLLFPLAAASAPLPVLLCLLEVGILILLTPFACSDSAHSSCLLGYSEH